MKKLLLILPLVVCCIICKAQAPNWLWEETGQSGGGFGYCSDMAFGPLDTIYIAGRNGSSLTLGGLTINTGGGTYPFIGKFDTSQYYNTNNNGIWLSLGLNSGFDYGYGICSDKEGNFYNTGDENSGGSAYVVKYNPKGVPIYVNNTPVSNGQGTGVVVDNAENVYETGNFSGGSVTFTGTPALPYGGSAWAGFLTKFDSVLNPIWSTRFSATDGSNQNYVTGKSVAEDLQGNIYVVGSYQGAAIFYSAYGNATSIAATPYADGPSSDGNLFIAKYDSSGVIQWVVSVQNAGMTYNSWGDRNRICVDSCGNIYVAGYFENSTQFGKFPVTAVGGNDMYVAKFNTKSMVWEWVQTGGGAGNTHAIDIALDKTSNVFVVGGYVSPSTFGDTILSGGNFFLAKYANSNGALQWIQSADLQGASAYLTGVAVDGQNYAYVVGTYSGTTSNLGPITLPSANAGSVFIAKMDTVPPRAIIPILDTSYCPGSTVTIPYTVIGTFNPGNMFTAQLSDSSGSFTNAINIGDTTLTGNGSITVTIPDTIPAGSNYLIRVVSSTPPTSSYANGCGAYYSQNVYPNDFYIKIGSGNLNATITPSKPQVCAGGSIVLSVPSSSGYTFNWNTGATTDSITVSPKTDTIYAVTVNNGGCMATVSDTVTVNAVLPLTILPPTPAVCNGQGISLTVPSSGTNYLWTPSNGLNVTTGDSVVASPTVNTTYTVSGTDSLGCSVTDSTTVTVNTGAPINVQPPTPASDCSGQAITLTVPTSGSNYTWSPSTGLNKTTGDTVIATPSANITYTVTGTDSSGCSATGTEEIDLSSGPSKPTITQHDSVLISSSTQSNQWLRNDTTLLGATNQDYIVTIPGYYQVIVSNPANGCSTTSDSIYATGINQLSAISNQLSIYPNPFNNNIVIKINSSAQDVNDWNMKITDVLGRTIYTKMSLNYSNDIDLSGLSSGVYFITIINNTARAVFPVVKQN